jgi:dihydrofolate reductase
MRKVKFQMQVSVDGFVAGPNGELDWMLFDWDETLTNYVTELTDSVDTILMGRKLAEGFIPYWAAVAAKAEDPQYEFGKKMTDKLKVIFSRTLKNIEWQNSTLADGTIEEEVAKLKQQPGKDLIIYGGAETVLSFIERDLIDEYHFFINPVIIGSGMSIFKDLERKKLKHIKTTIANNGIVVNCYEPAR